MAVTAAPGPAAASLHHLLGRLGLVEARVRAAVQRRRAGDPDPDDRFRGLYISAAQVDRILAADRQAGSPGDEVSAARQRLEAEADTALADGLDLRLRRLMGSFDLDELDVELLLIALAPDLDPRIERLYGYLQDDVSRRRATIGLGLELCALGPASAEARRRLAPGGPLVNGCLILVEDTERPLLTRSLRVPDRVTAHLLGDDTPDPLVAALSYHSDPLPYGDTGPLIRWLQGTPRLGYVREPPGASGVPLLAAACALSGQPILALDLQRLRPEDDLQLVSAVIGREARLRGAVVAAGPVEVLAGRGVPAVRAFSEMPITMVLGGALTWDPGWSRQVPFLWEAPVPTPAQRADMWRERLDGDSPPGLDPGTAMRQFRLTPEQVQRAATAARLRAVSAARGVDAADLKIGARAQNAAGLERLARRIEPAVSFRDLVLPPETLEQLRELVTRAQFKERVLDEWLMAGPAARRRGLTALFAGPSGTGKTMAAEVLAHALGLDVYAVDLATVVDKYVGETEKNLDRIFGEAERVNGVILFDEADALFGKRSEVSDAHDRYANVETAYLLQRMELFEGIAVLATNLRANLDEAFTRRLDAVVDFPEPEEADRLRLWERSLGTRLPRADDLDLPFLARAFKLSGGAIRNIAVAAAYMAAEEDRAVCMGDLIRATQREYTKMGRLCTESEFGRYHHLLARRSPAASG